MWLPQSRNKRILMPLSDDDKKRILEEEKFRAEARLKAESEANAKLENDHKMQELYNQKVKEYKESKSIFSKPKVEIDERNPSSLNSEEATSYMRSGYMTWGLLLFLVFIGLSVYSVSRNPSGSKVRAPKTPYAELEDKKIGVEVTCEGLVKKALKAPATAKFPNETKSYRINSSTNTSTYTAYVDAENGFGALIRNQFSCKYTLATNEVSLRVFR